MLASCKVCSVHGAYYLSNSQGIDTLFSQIQSMEEYETLINSQYKLDMFGVNSNPFSFRKPKNSVLEINHTVENAFNPGQTFYEDYVEQNQNNMLWSTLIDDLMAQIRIIK